MPLEVVTRDLPARAEFLSQCSWVPTLRKHRTPDRRQAIVLAIESGLDHVPGHHRHLPGYAGKAVTYGPALEHRLTTRTQSQSRCHIYGLAKLFRPAGMNPTGNAAFFIVVPDKGTLPDRKSVV